LLRKDRWEEFNLRPIIGKELPFYANLGIAQLERLSAEKAFDSIDKLIEELQADGIIIHVNPLQEWLQPEGDRIAKPPIEVIEEFVERTSYPVIVKEVGQGMGPASLKRLLKLPLGAIDFAAHGGTNFSKVELLRSNEEKQNMFRSLAHVGHSAEQMLEEVNDLAGSVKNRRCNQLIISGGVVNFLDGFYLIEKSTLPAIYGQGAAFLKRAQSSYQELQHYIQSQIEGLALAKAFLHLKTKH
jgi:isopentenyl-diphosphate delta-isomerase